MGWIIAAALIAILVLLGFPRLSIPREPDREGIDDEASVRAYDRVSRWLPFKVVRRVTLSELRKHAPRGVVVDIGCGPGYLAPLICQQFPVSKVIGVDIEEAMIRTALRNRSASVAVEFAIGDALHMPFRDNSIDYVVSTLSLHHWSSVTPALDEIYRILKPGGQFLILDLRRDSRRWFYYLLKVAQAVVVPGAIRRTNGAVGSLWASYTPLEIEFMLNQMPFHDWKVTRAPGWMFAWGYKL